MAAITLSRVNAQPFICAQYFRIERSRPHLGIYRFLFYSQLLYYISKPFRSVYYLLNLVFAHDVFSVFFLEKTGQLQLLRNGLSQQDTKKKPHYLLVRLSLSIQAFSGFLNFVSEKRTHCVVIIDHPVTNSCSASSLSCRYLNSYIKLKLILGWLSNYTKNFELK